MTAVFNYRLYILIRLSQQLSLIFFVVISVFACHQKEPQIIAIVWTNKKASGVTVPKNLLEFSENDSIEQHLKIRLEKNTAAMLGDYNMYDDYILFKPLIPFSRGLHYEIVFRDKPIGKIIVPLDSTATAPTLVAIYPTTGIVPENLLKVYLQFSAPMREGEALQHISILNSNNDTLPGVFLDLQPELWNKERTVLTVWLDPGRIKRDLIPNQKMGNPLKTGQHYTLAVSGKWRDAEGLPLQHSFNRQFTVGPRDSSSPQLQQWIIKSPQATTLQALEVDLGEPLDYFLLQETISILDEEAKVVDGITRVNDKEASFSFLPGKPWRAGLYRLHVESHLEDLAGNNLERLFDRDIRVPQVRLNNSMVEKEFIISGQR